MVQTTAVGGLVCRFAVVQRTAQRKSRFPMVYNDTIIGVDHTISCWVNLEGEEMANFIRAAIRLVKRGGKLIFAVPNSDGFEGLGYDLLQYPPHHMSWWTPNCF